uniref:UDP-glucuronosyltransferase n=1 Tax=Trichuris muris TaxID=70415 RepID=A0A5S6PYB0_TRIMR
MKLAIAALIVSIALYGRSKAMGAKKILFMPAMTAPSHVKSMLPLAKVLGKDGHKVTFVQYYSDESEKIFDDDIEFIHLSTYAAMAVNENMATWLWLEKAANPWELINTVSALGQGCHRSWKDEHNADFYQKLTTLYWDLLIVDNWARTFRAVNVPLSVDITANAETYEPIRFGNRLFGLLDGVEELTFWFIFTLAMETHAEGIPLGKWRVRDFHTNAVYTVGSVPSMLDIPLPQSANTFLLDYACPKAAELSDEYREFVEDPSSAGTIVFSLGHMADWRVAPAEVIQAFYVAFEELPQYRTVWQFNGNASLINKKSHIKVSQWLPLPALLQHPRTALFITHSGIKSFREAVCFAVPVVSVPLFVDQLRHAVLTLKHGIGDVLDKTKLSKQAVHNAIVTVLRNGGHKERVVKMSTMVGDKIIDDMQKGKFWINFYLRHPNSALHMRLKGTTLNSLAYHCYDAMILLCALLFAVHYTLVGHDKLPM